MSATDSANGTATTATTPSFQIWRPASGDDETVTLGADYVQVNIVEGVAVSVSVDGSETRVFEVSSGLSFNSGEMLGSCASTQPLNSANQRHRITQLYLPHPNGGVVLGSFSISGTTQTFTMSQTVASFPLIAVESGKVSNSIVN